MNNKNLADAILSTFQSPNVYDSNLEDANIVDVIDRLAAAINRVAQALENQIKIIGDTKHGTEA